MNRVTDKSKPQRSASGSTHTRREKSTEVKIDYSFAAFFFNGHFSERSEKTKESIKNIYPVL